jgi:HRAS-like suppressor 3
MVPETGRAPTLDSVEPARFARGDHLTVPGIGIVYKHHGIYLGNDRVIEFAGGLHPTVREASLAQFEKRGTATLVPHTRLKRWSVDVPPLPHDEVVARAQFLVKEVPPHRYSFVGFNCEHAVQWCKTGLPESYQIKAAIGVGAVSQVAVLALLRRQENRYRVVLCIGIPTFLVSALYMYESKRFWDDIGRKWSG